MFTGLIEATGTVRALHANQGAARLVVEGPPSLLRRLRVGDSISVSGVCLTAIEIDDKENTFAADLAAETVARTSLTQLKPDSLINLELPTPAGTPLGGHIVQGHVDGVGRLESLQPLLEQIVPRGTMGRISQKEREDGVELPHSVKQVSPPVGATDWWLRLNIPENCVRYVVEKGSITVEGISLTVARVESAADGAIVTIAVIPHTYAATNLHTLKIGGPLNIEVDVLAKYAEKLASHKKPEFQLTVEYLIANGY